MLQICFYKAMPIKLNCMLTDRNRNLTWTSVGYETFNSLESGC